MNRNLKGSVGQLSAEYVAPEIQPQLLEGDSYVVENAAYENRISNYGVENMYETIQNNMPETIVANDKVQNQN